MWKFRTENGDADFAYVNGYYFGDTMRAPVFFKITILPDNTFRVELEEQSRAYFESLRLDEKTWLEKAEKFAREDDIFYSPDMKSNAWIIDEAGIPLPHLTIRKGRVESLNKTDDSKPTYGDKPDFAEWEDAIKQITGLPPGFTELKQKEYEHRGIPYAVALIQRNDDLWFNVKSSPKIKEHIRRFTVPLGKTGFLLHDSLVFRNAGESLKDSFYGLIKQAQKDINWFLDEAAAEAEEKEMLFSRIKSGIMGIKARFESSKLSPKTATRSRL